MKAHAHRLLNVLPDLCISPLVRQVRVTFPHEVVEPVIEARVDAVSLQLCRKEDEELEIWGLYDRDQIVSIEAWLDVRECLRVGIDPQIGPVLAYLDEQRKRR